jgi:hypothetical protein
MKSKNRKKGSRVEKSIVKNSKKCTDAQGRNLTCPNGISTGSRQIKA